MKPYSSLTVHGQARRLRALALNALSQYALDIARLRLVTNDMNGIFRTDTTDGKRFILRVTVPEGGHTLDHVAAEMDWLAALARDTDLSVPQPLPAKNGSLVVKATAVGVPEQRLCAIFSWVPGKNLADDMSAVNISRLGELMARLHIHALMFRPLPDLSLLHFDRVFPFPEPVVLFDESYAALFTPQRRVVYRKAVAWAQESIGRLKTSGEPMRILHGDLHQWNVRCYRGRLYPIDFQDLFLGWPVQDVAATLYSFFPLDDYQALREAFRQGYTRRLSWPERYPGEIEAFIAAQGLFLSNFILNDPNPEWRAQTAEFIERVERRLHLLMDLHA
jgi:Ser/Thr protein kinase RdoA (MazF antagonist)